MDLIVFPYASYLEAHGGLSGLASVNHSSHRLGTRQFLKKVAVSGLCIGSHFNGSFPKKIFFETTIERLVTRSHPELHCWVAVVEQVEAAASHKNHYDVCHQVGQVLEV